MKHFRTGLTRELLILLVVDVLLAGGMILCGLQTNRFWPGLGWPSIALGTFVAAAALTLASGARPRELLVDGTGVTLRGGIRDVRVSWDSFRTFLPHPAGRRFLRRTVLGDGRRSIVLESLVFPEYEEIVETIGRVRQRYQREVGRIA